ncbi:hypothetical protein [Clostridium butyricum]|uniref:hypothetical protein n=1 Tax=Clostridium butyricum TaxID=1492 RepID=UPI00325B830F
MNEQITVLSDKDKCRKKINIWHGSANAWLKMINELVGNSLDVFEKIKLNTGENITKNICIKIHNKNKIEYIDDGTGIPLEGIASDGRSNYEAIFEVPFAGSNYEDEVATVGTNGVFLWTLSMSSENIEYFIARPDGNIYNISYHKGDRVKDLNIIGKSNKTYTRAIFELDEDVWDSPNFTFEDIKYFIKGQSSLSNVRITLEDIENNIKEDYYYKNGIEEYFNELIVNKTIISDNICINKSLQHVIKTNELDVYDKVVKKEIIDSIDCGLVFNFSNDSNDVIQKDYLNTADLIQHGTIQDGIILGIKNSVNKWLKDNNKYDKKDKPISLEDVSSSLNYICNIKSLKAKYVSQVKQQTIEPHYKTVLKDITEEFMNIYLLENKLDAERICTQILINSKARLSADKTRQTLKKKLSELGGNTVEIQGLTDCNMKESGVEERILLVVEGLSPKQTAVDSYDNRYMGALGLRGRFISCLKKSVDDVLNNIPAYTLIQALGCGIEIPQNERKKFKDIETFDIDKLRYGSIGIMVDADCFGSGISLGILTFIHKYLPTLLKQGRVFLVKSPRYEIKLKNDKMLYPYNDFEKENLMKTIDKNEIVNIEVVKGLGSVDKEVFWDVVLKPEVRDKTFIQIDYDETEELVNKYFEDFMGENVAPRKEFVKNNINTVDFEDLN